MKLNITRNVFLCCDVINFGTILVAGLVILREPVERTLTYLIQWRIRKTARLP